MAFLLDGRKTRRRGALFASSWRVLSLCAGLLGEVERLRSFPREGEAVRAKGTFVLELHRALCSSHPRSFARPHAHQHQRGEGRGRRDSVGKAMSATAFFTFLETLRAAGASHLPGRLSRRRETVEDPAAALRRRRKGEGGQAAAPHTSSGLGLMRGADPSAALTPPLPPLLNSAIPAVPGWKV